MLRTDSDASFLEKLYTENYSLVYKFVVYSIGKYGMRQSDVPDLVQDVFVRAARRIDVVRAHPNPKGWLIKTSYYVCKNYISTYVRRGERLFETMDLHADRKDAYSEINTLLSLEQILKPDEYALLKAYYIEERPTEEICRDTGFSPNLLRVRMHRLKKYLTAFFVFLVIFASNHNI